MFIFDIPAAVDAQKEYCEKNNYPHFAPSNGICWCCGKNIYSVDGISVERAANNLITGCPFCHRSYCD